MRIPLDSNEAFNVNIVGSWNPAIFTPAWVKTNLANDPSKEVTFALPMHMANLLQPRITVEGVNLYPASQSLTIDCVEYNDDRLPECAEKTQKLCQLLEHTPVNAIGINFRFHGRVDESGELTDLFTFADAGRIDASRYASTGSAIRRSFRLGDSDSLNFSAELFPDILRMEFNYHSDVTSTADAATKAVIERILEKRAAALEFLSTVYNVEIDN